MVLLPLHTVTFYTTGTGNVDKVGEGRGSFYSVNVPLNDGIRDQPFIGLFTRYISATLFITISLWMGHP